MDTLVKPLVLEINETDLDPETRGSLASKREGARHLGTKELMDALPRAIAKRLEQITPPDFDMSEVTMRMAVKGSPFGFGIDGEVVVKFAPKRS